MTIIMAHVQVGVKRVAWVTYTVTQVGVKRKRLDPDIDAGQSLECPKSHLKLMCQSHVQNLARSSSFAVCSKAPFVAALVPTSPRVYEEGSSCVLAAARKCRKGHLEGIGLKHKDCTSTHKTC